LLNAFGLNGWLDEAPDSVLSAIDIRRGDIRDPGFMRVYIEDRDDPKPDDNKENILPLMQQGDIVDLREIRLEQHFTEPPPRFSEASLVKTLEEYGIGRPSTYASIITTLLDREYVELENKRFHPTDVGRVVSRFLTQHFPQYVDYDFTAQLEDSLDEISRGETDWLPLMENFWTTFKSQVDDKMENVSRDEAIQSRQLGVDTCGINFSRNPSGSSPRPICAQASRTRSMLANTARQRSQMTSTGMATPRSKASCLARSRSRQTCFE